MQKFLNKISGLQFLVCNILGIAILQRAVYLELGNKLLIILGLTIAAISLYVTYYRFVRIDFGKKLFVFYCVLIILEAVYGAEFSMTLGWVGREYSSWFEQFISAFSPLYKLLIFVFNLLLIFKNAKEKP